MMVKRRHVWHTTVQWPKITNTIEPSLSTFNFHRVHERIFVKLGFFSVVFHRSSHFIMNQITTRWSSWWTFLRRCSTERSVSNGSWRTSDRSFIGLRSSFMRTIIFDTMCKASVSFLFNFQLMNTSLKQCERHDLLWNLFNRVFFSLSNKQIWTVIPSLIDCKHLVRAFQDRGWG